MPKLSKAEQETVLRVAASAGAKVDELMGKREEMEKAHKATAANAAQALQCLNAQHELAGLVRAARKGACQPASDLVVALRALARTAVGVHEGDEVAGHVRVLLGAGEGQRDGPLRPPRGVEFVVPGGAVRDVLCAWKRACRVRIGAERWDARGGVFQSLPALNVGRFCHAAAAVARSNEVLVVGGLGRGNVHLDSVERLGLGGHGNVDSAWRTGPPLASAQARCGACAVGDEVVVVVGGEGPHGDNLDSVVAVDAVSGSRKQLPALPSKLFACGVVSLPGKVIVTGGDDGTAVVRSVWVLNVGDGGGVDTVAKSGAKRGFTKGGFIKRRLAKKDARVPSLSWAPLASMAQARCRHGAAAGDGRVFVCGGFNGHRTEACEVLAVRGGAGAWKALPSLPVKLCDVGCCFGGGNLFVGGGTPGYVADLYVLGAGAEAWALVGRLENARCSCAMVCVGKRVLVLGGYNGYRGASLGACEEVQFDHPDPDPDPNGQAD